MGNAFSKVKELVEGTFKILESTDSTILFLHSGKAYEISLKDASHKFQLPYVRDVKPCKACGKHFRPKHNIQSEIHAQYCRDCRYQKNLLCNRGITKTKFGDAAINELVKLESLRHNIKSKLKIYEQQDSEGTA